MPYDIFNTNSVMDAWNQSAFDKTRQTEAENNIADRVQVAAEQSGLLNDVANRTGSLAAVAPAVAAQPAPTTATQMAAQGGSNVGRKPTPAEYEAGVINYLVNNRGYSYEDAAELMAPRIAMYKAQDTADKQQQAKSLAMRLNEIPVDSDEYRAGAYRMAQLDPDMAKLYLHDMVSRRDVYNQNRALAAQAAARQQKREDAIFNANLGNQSYMQRRQMVDAYERQRMQEQYNWLVNNGYDKQQAMGLVLGNRGGGRNGNAAAGNNGLLSSANLKIIENEYNKMLEQVQDGTLPASERGRFMYYGNFLKQNADRLAGYGGQANNSSGATLQAMFDNQVKLHGYSDDLVRAFKDAAAKNGVNLTDDDMKTLAAKYKKA